MTPEATIIKLLECEASKDICKELIKCILTLYPHQYISTLLHYKILYLSAGGGVYLIFTIDGKPLKKPAILTLKHYMCILYIDTPEQSSVLITVLQVIFAACKLLDKPLYLYVYV